MKQDILLCGVGGQGILSVAYVIDQAAMESGYFLKQPEVHGMSQRGGAVQAHVRVSDVPIASDLISQGEADLLLALEPLEALRYLRFLTPEPGRVFSDITPFANIPDYPDPVSVCEKLWRLPATLLVNGAHLAKKAGSPKAQNMVVLGAASGYLPYPSALLEKHIATLFARKSERLVNVNLNAFRMGRAAGDFCDLLIRSGVSGELAARLIPWLDFQPWPVPEPVAASWLSFFANPRAGEVINRLWSEGVAVALDEEVAGCLLAGKLPGTAAAGSVSSRTHPRFTAKPVINRQ
jgi:indolepyruvate ferredoxin oxidoreductase, beta subunit